MKKWSREGTTPPKISVVVAVYNKPRALRFCLEGYRRQTFYTRLKENFQIILADDGSQSEIEEIFLQFSKSVPFTCTYLFQEDRGWGKIRMLNWAILESQSEQIIFTDGDCVPHKCFIQAHYEEQKENTVLCGRRVDLMEAYAKELSLNEIKNGTLDSFLWFFKNLWSKKIDYIEQSLYLPSWIFRALNLFRKNKKPTLLGSNFSIHKKWLREVNGFDESFKSPGLGEDTDIERRFLLCGLKLNWVTHRTIQYHLWHPLTKLGDQSVKTFELHQEKGNKKALLGLKELEEFLNQK